MDSGSWIHGYAANSNGGGGFMCGYAASCIPSVLQCREQQEDELLLSSQIQQHLNQISMHMSMDEVEPVPSCDIISSIVDDFDFLPDSLHATSGCSFPSSSSNSSSLRSPSLSCSLETSSTAPHVLAAPGVSSFHEVSSQVPLLLPYEYDHQYAVNFHDTSAAVAPCEMSTRSSAFRSYDRHIGPRWRPTKPACGQRMFKTAMSVLDKMHTAMRYSHQQQQQNYYYQQQQQQELAEENSGNQLQHMISERKRREKLNGSFHALRTVLPPGSKKDKTSILITAREYVNSLKSKVRELEEKNQALQAQLALRPAIQRSAADGDQSREVCTVNTATSAWCP